MQMAFRNGFYCIHDYRTTNIYPRRNWAAIITGSICGTATIVSGVAVLCTQNPTNATKVSGAAGIVAGVAGILWT